MKELCYVGMKNYSYDKLGDIIIEKPFLTGKKILSVTDIVEGEEGEYYPYRRSTDKVRKVYEPFPIICVAKGHKLYELFTGIELTSLPALKKNGLELYKVKAKRFEVETRTEALSSSDTIRYQEAINNLNENISLRYNKKIKVLNINGTSVYDNLYKNAK